MTGPAHGRAERRRARRRAQVRQTALLLGILFLAALAIAVWLALDAPRPPTGAD